MRAIIIDDEAGAGALSDNIMLSLAEQLKAPWLVVARAAEAGLNQTSDEQLLKLFEMLSSSSGSALQGIESYLLAAQLEHSQTSLNFEPVPLTSLMYDIAHSLDAYAKSQNCRIILNTKGKLGPVISNKRALSAAMLTMGHSFIDAAQADTAKSSVTFDVRPSQDGLVSAGIFANNQESDFSGLNRAKKLSNRARQPLKQFSLRGGAGILVAETIFTSLHTSLRAARLKGAYGLSAVLTPSRQLNLL